MSDITRIQSALQAIPASDRDTWTRVGMGLHSELGEAGFSIWDEWSRTADNYDESAARETWHSFGHGNTRKVTIGTVYYLAKEHGWAAPPYKKRAAREMAELLQEFLGCDELCKLAPDDHPYLVRKGVSPTGTVFEATSEAIRAWFGYYPPTLQEGRVLVLPLQTPDGDVRSAQFIDEVGGKRSLAGGKQAGAVWLDRDEPDLPEDSEDAVILVGEGMATARSASLATGWPCVATCGKGMLRAALGALRERYQLALLVVLADLDKRTGRADEGTRIVAGEFGALLAAPDFGGNVDLGQSDWNDLAQARGLDEVRRQLDQVFQGGLDEDAGADPVCDDQPTEAPPAPIASDAEVAAFFARHAMVSVGGRSMAVYRQPDPTTGHMTTVVTPVADLDLLYRNRRVFDPLKGRLVSLPSVWLDSPERRTYRGLSFSPRKGVVAGSLDLPPGDHLNLYQGLSIQPRQGACGRILDHIRDVWASGNDIAYRYVLDWLACLYKRPGEKGRTALHLKSLHLQGAGKNIIIDKVLMRAFGEHGVTVTNSDHLVGKFNSHLATACLVYANESTWGGDHASEGTLKALISDDFIRCEAKYRPAFEAPNCVHLILASNSAWSAPIDAGDRRYVTLEVSDAKRGDRAHFAALLAEIQSGGAEAFAWEMLHRDISKFDPEDMPDMAAAGGLIDKLHGLSHVESWWYSCLWDESISVTRDDPGAFPLSAPRRTRVNLAEGWARGPVHVEPRLLHESFMEWGRRLGRGHLEDLALFGQLFRRLCATRMVRPWVKEGERPRMYEIPALSECRAQMDRHMKGSADWEDSEAA